MEMKKSVIILGAAVLLSACCERDGDALTPETERLLRTLREVPQKGYMFGHQDATVYGIGWDGDRDRSDVKSVCGDYPAVCGWEIGHIELGDPVSLDSVPFDRIRSACIEHFERGGINTVSWHLDNPLTGGSSWDTSGGTAVVASVLPGGANHQKFLGWLDRLASYLDSFETAEGVKVPILFRPWHEHTGSWFWWGKEHCTPEEYRQLWTMTHDYLRKKGLRHLLYAYSPAGGAPQEDSEARYPGDDRVDLLGFDYYQLNGTAGEEDYVRVMDDNLKRLVGMSKLHDKPIAVTETGFETVPDSTWWTRVLHPVLDRYPVSYVLVWRNARERPNHYYAPYPGQISAGDFMDFYGLPQTLFAGDVKRLDL